MNADAVFTLQAATGLVFSCSAGMKFLFPGTSVQVIRDYNLVPSWSAWPVGLIVIGAETFVGLTHLTGASLALGVVLSLLLITLFATAVTVNLVRGRTVPCGCFAGSRDVISPRTLFRLAMLATGELIMLTALVTRSSWVPGGVTFMHAAYACVLIQLSIWILNAPELAALGRFILRDVDRARGAR